MEQTKWKWVSNTLTQIAMVLLYIIKGVFWLAGWLSQKIVQLSELGLQQLKQNKENVA